MGKHWAVSGSLELSWVLAHGHLAEFYLEDLVVVRILPFLGGEILIDHIDLDSPDLSNDVLDVEAHKALE